MTLLEKLNSGEHVVTYEMLQVRPDRKPVVGEIRYIIPLIPSPFEPLAAMIPANPIQIIWDGKQWLDSGRFVTRKE